MRDLHALTRELGTDAVAAAAGVSPRALVSMRSGDHPITVDVLYRLVMRFGPDFDLLKTVSRVGSRRVERGIMPPLPSQ